MCLHVYIMFLALHHSAHIASMFWYSSGVFGGCGFIYFRNFFVRFKGKTSLVSHHCASLWTKWGFSPEEKLCSGISVGWIFASICSGCEAVNDGLEDWTLSEHVNISSKELVWIVGVSICTIGFKKALLSSEIKSLFKRKKISILEKASI